MSDFNRRTVVRGAAWTVPVVAVAAHAPAFAASPVTIILTFAGACASTGSTSKGCGTDKALQIPLTVDNRGSLTAVTFQVTSLFVRNGGTPPTQADFLADPVNVKSGVTKISATTVGFGDQSDCRTPAPPISPATSAACAAGAVPNGYVTVAGGQLGTFWVVAPSTGSASNFAARVNYRLLDAACSVIPGSDGELAGGQNATAIPSGNCR